MVPPAGSVPGLVGGVWRVEQLLEHGRIAVGDLDDLRPAGGAGYQ